MTTCARCGGGGWCWGYVTRFVAAVAVATAITSVEAVQAQSTTPATDQSPTGVKAAVTTDTPPHPFFDPLNNWLTFAESAALLADGITTQHNLKLDPIDAYEADPIARPFVNAGWPGMIAGGALFVSADVGLRYIFHRKNHHRVERFVPLVLLSYGTFGAVANMRAAHNLDIGHVLIVGLPPPNRPR